MNLESFQKKKEYLICIDSDGTAIDSMNIKHNKCFGPCMIKEWSLYEHEKLIQEIWNQVNLFSLTRGVNRFLGLLEVMKQIDDQGIHVDGVWELASWINKSDELSNKALIQEIVQSGNDTLIRVLRWSEQVNIEIDRLTWEEHQPFEGVMEFLEESSKWSDIAIISSANMKAIEEEWEHFGLIKYVGVMTSQEIGTKEVCINKLLEKGYHREKVIMIGDAPADLEAARNNGISYYPILAGRENECWKKIREDHINAFQKGFMKNIQSRLDKRFLGNLRNEVSHK